MTTVPIDTTKTHARERSALDRALAAIPVIALGLCVLTFYGVEAWSRKTPWIFTDEIEWTQISRSIATTGHAARRGQPVFFKSIYAFLIAPFWWFNSTTTAYSAIKFVNVVLMTLAAVPTYLLARMLVTRRTALVVAVLSVSVPAMAYVTTIIPEVAAYPYYALCSWLVVRGFTTGRRRDIALAGIISVLALLVRSPQFITIPAAFVIAAAGLWITGPRGREMRKNWTRGDTMGAIVLLAGSLFLFNRVVLQHLHQWQFATQYYKNRMVDLGLDAALSFVIGMGVLPVIGGLASLRVRERSGEPAYRAFVAWASATILCVSLYTADKAAFLSTEFATLWEERNLIYLAPIMLIGTAIVYEAKRLDWRVLAGATAFVAIIVGLKQFQFGFPYFEAPGLALPALLHNHRGWSPTDLREASFAMVAVSLGLLALRRWRAVAALGAMLLIAWMLATEIANTVGIDDQADAFRAHLPSQLNWVDAITHGQPVTYLGQTVKDANGVWLSEFWNRSIRHVDTLDGIPLGPGPSARPNILSPDGLLSGFSGDHYVLGDVGVVLDATVVASLPGGQTLYHHNGPWHLVQAVQQQYDDGWCPEWCSFTYYKPHQKGTLQVTLSRTAYNGSAPPGHVMLVVGTVHMDQNGAPQILHSYAHVNRILHNNSQETVDVPVKRTPVRVEVFTNPTIPPSASDTRSLGAQVGFKFVPAKPTR